MIHFVIHRLFNTYNISVFLIWLNFIIPFVTTTHHVTSLPPTIHNGIFIARKMPLFDCFFNKIILYKQNSKYLKEMNYITFTLSLARLGKVRISHYYVCSINSPEYHSDILFLSIVSDNYGRSSLPGVNNY